MRTATLVGLAAASLALTSPAHAGSIVLNIVDPPGVGFNDPTLVAPIGGNPGTTLGEQRQIVFQTAASIWEATLGPNVDIVIQSSFSPLACSATSGVLGAAGTIQIFANFDGARWPNTWYHSALANHLAGFDLSPGLPDPGLLQPPYNDDIVAFFNGDIGVNEDCLTGLTWYNGLDNNAPGNAFDLLNVVLHEFAHGLGFANFVDDATGNAALGISDIYSVYSYDNEQGLYWNQMDKRQRAVSAVNTGDLVWHGPKVTADAPGFLSGLPVVRVSGGPDLEAQPASYGVPLTAAGVTGPVALYDDGTGPDPNDACDAFDPSVAGKVALINRGTCPFAFKSLLAEISGAVGVIVANNQPSGLPPMGGSLIGATIPSVGISKADGDYLKGILGTTVTLLADPALGYSGADADGFVKLYAPNPVQPGSSVSHFDTTLTPNALMEPFISSDLKGATTLDLTPDLMTDIGWSPSLSCPVGADDRTIVAVGSCSTGVSNALGPFGFSAGVPRSVGSPRGNANGVDSNGGCYVQDLVNACEKQGSSGKVLSCLQHATQYLERSGALSASDTQAILACTN